MSKLKVFISHSSRDKVLAEAVGDLIRGAFNLPAREIRCTSADGHRLRTGAHSSTELRQDVLGASVVIAIISPASMASPYVLLELGARWGNGGALFPVFAPGSGPEVLRGFLTEMNALACESQAEMIQLVRDLAPILRSDFNPPDSFLRKIEIIQQARGPADSGHQRVAPVGSTPVITGFMHLNSTLFHEVGERVSKIMRDEVIPTKYLFSHADSYEHYLGLVKYSGYSFFDRTLTNENSERVSERLFRDLRPIRELTVVSLGIGFGENDIILLEKLRQRMAISFVAIDINPAFLQVGMAEIRKWERSQVAQDGSLQCQFVIGDFDEIDQFGPLWPADRPILFVALGGTFGNQEERKFLQKLRRVSGAPSYLLMDFQSKESLKSREKAGYESERNKQFVSKMIEAYCGEVIPPTSIEAIYDHELYNRRRKISEVPNAETLVMVGKTVAGENRLFGYSTGYNKTALRNFLHREAWDVIDDFEGKNRKSNWVFLSKLAR